MQYNNYHVKRIYLALLTLYDPSPRVMEIKTKGNKWDLIKPKSFCTGKDNKQGEKTVLRMGENNSK